jgi:polar amino acid transport system substrate-binding protein
MDMLKTASKSLLLPAIALSLVLGGFSSMSTASGATRPSQSHLGKILKSKVIKIGIGPDSAPWSVLDAAGNYKGFDVDIANALAKTLDAKIVFVNTDALARIPALQTNKVDVIIASFAATPLRAQSVEMTIPYAAAGTRVLVQVGSTIKNYKDLNGKSVSAPRGSIAAGILASRFPKVKAVLFGSTADALQALKSNKVDAYMDGSTTLAVFAQNDPDKVKILDAPDLQSTLVSMGVKQDDQIWLNYLNTFIRSYNGSGENDIAYDKWFGTDMQSFLK